MKLTNEIQNTLVCPVCQSTFTDDSDKLVCVNSECKTEYPIIAGVPILINEKNSLFLIEDFAGNKITTFDPQTTGTFRTTVNKWFPQIGQNIASRKSFQTMVDSLNQLSPNSRVLIIGCGFMGSDFEVLLENKHLELVNSDVALGPEAQVICDCHDLPFKNNSFDGVVIQAVLEHVVDPNRCIEEVYRVLKNEGIVYSDTPFMQQVHMGRYDFTRFTHLGHRRLFRRFDEIKSGVSCGPGMALAWSYQYFLFSFTTSLLLRSFIAKFVNLSSFFLKYFDHYLAQKAGSFDSASSFYFIGRKSKDVLSDRDLLKLYRGLS